MKALALLLALAPLAADANNSWKTVLEKRMPLAECHEKINEYMIQNDLRAEPLGLNDYVLTDQARTQVGSAYYSVGTCYILLSQ